MAPKQVLARVLQKTEVAPGHWRLELAAPTIAAAATPGQFIHLDVLPVGRKTAASLVYDPLLRRPFSVHACRRETGVISLLFRVVGRGTALLAQVEPGEELDLLGPLGNGFRLPAPPARALLVGGGLGIAPLLFLGEELQARGVATEVFLGARTGDELLAEVDFCRLVGEERLHVATEDGSRGQEGLVTKVLQAFLVGKGGRCLAEAEEGGKIIYACGPEGMLAAVAAIARTAGLPCQVSLEERMGCGVGACLACVCKVKKEGGRAPAGADGATAGAEEEEYARVCAEGPVFDARQVYPVPDLPR